MKKLLIGLAIAASFGASATNIGDDVEVNQFGFELEQNNLGGIGWVEDVDRVNVELGNVINSGGIVVKDLDKVMDFDVEQEAGDINQMNDGRVTLIDELDNKATIGMQNVANTGSLDLNVRVAVDDVEVEQVFGESDQFNKGEVNMINDLNKVDMSGTNVGNIGNIDIVSKDVVDVEVVGEMFDVVQSNELVVHSVEDIGKVDISGTNIGNLSEVNVKSLDVSEGMVHQDAFGSSQSNVGGIHSADFVDNLSVDLGNVGNSAIINLKK